jgi:acetylornithine deacetylase
MATADPDDASILAAVAAERDAIVELLTDLVEAPTLLGDEELGQVVMERGMRDAGLDPVDVPMDAEALRAHPACAPFSWDVGGKRNVVARWGGGSGRSLLLNGHIDVVSPEPVRFWRTQPFRATIEDDWMYGRGAGDMKAGLAAMVGAVRGLRWLGLKPAGPVTLQSVVEEECGGNGALACLIAGHTADAAVVVEPFGAAITVSQVGVVWFDVRVAGVPAHAADAAAGNNAIEAMVPVIRALRALETELNEVRPPPYDAYPHPINLNVGVIHGGDWPSTVAGECCARFRLALYPGESVEALRGRIEAAVASAAETDAYLAEHPPEVTYDGFACEGYAIAGDELLVAELSATFARQAEGPPAQIATTGTTDARTFGLHGGIPSVCFGPYAEGAHGVDERVYLPSVVQTAQVLALFIRDWCGVTG